MFQSNPRSLLRQQNFTVPVLLVWLLVALVRRDCDRARALAAPPDEARRVLGGVGANYVMVCGPRPPDGLPEPARGRSLWGRLQAGTVPDWLVAMPGTQPLAVYRVRQ